MELTEVVARLVGPALARLPLSMTSDKAKLMMLAIGLQESRFLHRYQVLNGTLAKGPARGFWQFEQGGGVKGVMTHHQTAGHAHLVCAERGVPFERPQVWMRLETDDILAGVFARLLLYSDPRSLPEADDAEGAWKLYERTWRPGKPHRQTWDRFHMQARQELGLA